MRTDAGGPATGRQLIDPPVRMGGDPQQYVFEIRERGDVDQLAALDMRIQEGGAGRPLPDVTLALDGRETRSDRTGRFLLPVDPWTSRMATLVIDARTANQGSWTLACEYVLLRP